MKRLPAVATDSSGTGAWINPICDRVMLGLLRRVKNAALADQTRYRRLPFGLCRGMELPLNLRCHLRIYLGLYEREIRDVVRLSVKPRFSCYDIGAGIGYYALALTRLASDGWVCAVEADPQACRQIQESIRRNRKESRIRVLHCALGGKLEPPENRWTLDALVYGRGYPLPDFVKIDVEGAEYDVLRGARRVIRQVAPRFVIEVHSEELERCCRSLLLSEGYRLRVIPRSSFLPEHRPLAHNQWLHACPSTGLSEE